MRIAIVVLLLPLNILCYSQSITPNLSARSGALGNTHIHLKEVFSVLGNGAVLANINHSQVGIGYEINPQWQGANKRIACLATPIKKGAAQFGLMRFGDDIYQEIVAVLGYAHNINQSSIGLSTTFIQYQAKGFGSTSAINFNFGCIHQFGESIHIGAYLQNIIKTEINEAFREKLPTRMAIGIMWKAAKKISVYSELMKDLDYATQIRFGIEYQANDKFFIRSGLQPKPSLSSAGFGFTYKKVIIDTSIQYFWRNSQFRQQTTLSYTLNKK